MTTKFINGNNNNTTKLLMKHEVNSSNLIRPLLEYDNENDKMKNDEINKLLSVIIAQEEKLERHDKLLNALLRTEQTRNARNRVYWKRIVLLAVSFLLLFVVLYMGYLSSTYLHKDSVLYLNVKATPTKAPFITAGVKVRFTMGDLVSCMKGAFSGDTIALSLS